MFQLRAVISVLKRRRKRRREREKEAISSVGNVLYSGRSKMENTGAPTAHTATYIIIVHLVHYIHTYIYIVLLLTKIHSPSSIVLVYSALVSVAQSKIVAWCLLAR